MSKEASRSTHQAPNTEHKRFAMAGQIDSKLKEFSAFTVDEAVTLACAELGVRREDLTYEIRDSGLLNILGVGSDLATIVVHAGMASEAARVPPSGLVGQHRSAITRPPPGELDPSVVEEAAYRFHIPESSVRQKVRRGDLIYDPDRRRLVGTFDSRSSTGERQRGVGPSAGASERLPQGYWDKVDRMILRFQRGERELLWTIVQKLEPIVRAVVDKIGGKCRPSGLEVEDLLQIGRIEIIGLLGSYDPRAKTRIYVYMRHWLYYRILRVVDDNLPVRVPANLVPGSGLEQRAAFFRSPTAYEQLEEITEDSFVSEEEGFEEALWENLYRKVVTSARLSERHLYVLEHRYGLNGRSEKTLEQVGGDLNLTREGVRQVQLKAIADLKRTPEFFATALHGDFSLGEPPESQPSISAVQEWAGPLLPYKNSAESTSPSKVAQPARTDHPFSKRGPIL